MISRARRELVCDFAEVYHVHDVTSLPVRHFATLAAGLRHDSRTRLKLSGQQYSVDTLLRAIIADRIAAVCGTEVDSIYDILTGRVKSDASNTAQVFDSPEEYEAARARILGGI